ncbi:MAG TPA: diacylglucosamine hydrolase [Bacteroidales bacterium]|nr:diacylglucosamine hydrolase [Bacteroidales bacterium]
MSVLLHSCCAPCSAAILEWMLNNDIEPVVFFYNPNIFPREEYEHRKDEIVRHCEHLGVQYLDGDYDHSRWLAQCAHLAYAPERGERCSLCFRMRLLKAAQVAKEHGIERFATTLASSRWKNIEQVNQAGKWAEQQVEGVTFWANNWRKGGLQQRRQELLKQYCFYNQLYCGCEFSIRHQSNS